MRTVRPPRAFAARKDDATRRVRITAGLSGLLPLLALTACATLPGGDAMGEALQVEPPYRTGRLPSPPPEDIRFLPVTFQRPDDPVGVETGPGTPLHELLDRIAGALRGIDGLAPLADGPAGGAPDVRFGCQTDAIDECEPLLNPSGGPPPMVLGVRRPTPEWSARAIEAMAAADADALLIVTLEIGQYWPRQLDWRGNKGVELGTGHRQDLPWLTSLDDPVQVLQLTAALVAADGSVVRIGAEGMIARRSNLLVSAIGAQELLSDEDVRAVLAARRTDLPGAPPLVDTAVRDLVAGVTGRGW